MRVSTSGRRSSVDREAEDGKLSCRRRVYPAQSKADAPAPPSPNHLESTDSGSGSDSDMSSINDDDLVETVDDAIEDEMERIVVRQVSFIAGTMF